MAATSCGAAADAASTDAGGAPSRMVRAFSRVRDVLEPVGETLAVVSSVLGVAVGVMEIIQDVRYIVDSARGALDRGDGVDPPGEGGGLVDLAGDPLNSSSKGLAPVNGDRTGSSVRAKLESKLIRTGERSYHNQCKLNCQTQRDIPFENLPEDVIRTIFSQLPLQDLVRTSALSSKWRIMWTICPKLRFDGGRLCGNDTYKIQQCTQKFIDNVNTVLQQHEGNLVDTLEVKIEFSSMLVNHLNNWVRFATEHLTKNLTFDLAMVEFGGRNDHYIFPIEFLDIETLSRLEQIQLSFVSLELPSQFSGWPNLKKLDLHLLRISREDLQDMLSSCPSLEWLSLVRCHLNDELKLDRPFTRLIYLQVAHCQITKIQLRAVNLKTFIYRGRQLPLDLSHVKELETVNTCFFDVTFEYALTVLPSELPSVRNLHMQAHLLLKSPWLLENSCKFFMLKHLKLLMFHLHEDMHNILSLASFLKAAPLVEKFEIDFNIFGLINDLETDSLRSLPSCPYNYLRDVCITGYQGDIGQLELVVHIVQNAPVLEVLTIDRTTRRGAHVNRHSGERPGIAVRRHLEGKILPTTKLEII
uniref:Uncharacterized protein n=1 Tax=Avena sativa TaxID=4498 RepID=A0ACD6AFZ6_AVESA